ncbi:ABC1 kinase family protein [Microbacterium rhizosphaerae]|uniref:AarF/UbiB family protein n=1 Tax=Microbacterium rhizosphaerae TaxID=1678237 RepID=A0ABZ0SJL0_9MICO|nr:AarF/UbiB family protein [Microbacterium rhizosphaerae]WPR88294.1 AarF/UbiB family protein [Microbacterium rhizosphaerae]
MPYWLAVGLFGVGFAVLAAWAARRLLDRSVGWMRSVVTAFIVFIVALPLTTWSLDAAGVVRGGQVVAELPIAVSFFVVTLGWLFAGVVVCIVTLEFAWPSHGLRNPIASVREAFRRRDRAKRYTQILSIASRHGVALFGAPRTAPRDLPTALVDAMNEAGVTFVKLGQVLSARDDLLPREFVDAFATLQMESTPISWADAEAAIRAELRRPLDEVFARIDPEPLAAASVAQVHAAQLRDGNEVIVKIQRPLARRQVTTDLDILRRLAADLERRTDWAKEYGAAALVEEFARGLYDELDYRIEIDNAEMLRVATAQSPSRLRIPMSYAQLSTERMLVQERVRGTPLTHVSSVELPAQEASAIADEIASAVFDQVLLRGVFHADLHAGNLILGARRGEGEPRDVTLIDFGSVGIIEKSLRRLLVPLLIAIANEDDTVATDLVLLICGYGDSLRKPALQRDIGVVITRVRNSPTHDDIFRLLLDALRRHRLAIPPSLLLVLRTLSSLEGTLRLIQPDYDLTRRGLELAPTAAVQQLSIRDAILSAQSRGAVLMEGARRLSRRIESVSRALDEGTFSLRMRVFETGAERSWVDALMSRMTITVIGVTLVIAGVLLAVSSTGPMLTTDVRAFGFLGSVLALGGLLLLLRSLGRSFRGR